MDKTTRKTTLDIDAIAQELVKPYNDDLAKILRHSSSTLSFREIERLVERMKSILFPGIFDLVGIGQASMRYHVTAQLDQLHSMLTEQIRLGICFFCTDEDQEQIPDSVECVERSRLKAIAFIDEIPHIRDLLLTDIRAAFEGDPAAKSEAEVILCYPSIKALLHHRIAHALYSLGIPIIPRIISEMAHSQTGIDIHPGASIAESFFIDHGTGVVIGETGVIGKHCRVYQGVTLGALSFPKDAQGNIVKNLPRHPVLEDNVIVYSGATILGRVTIGKGAVIGGNVWLTQDVPPGAKIVQQQSIPTQTTILGKAGA